MQNLLVGIWGYMEINPETNLVLRWYGRSLKRTDLLSEKVLIEESGV